jgi:uncharacterized protein (DUF4415 family)
MAKKQSGSSARGRRPVKKEKHIADSKINFSDIPEATTAELKRARRVGRPKADKVKQLIAIRIDPELLLALRKLAAKRRKPYQSLLHDLLELAVKEAA